MASGERKRPAHIGVFVSPHGWGHAARMSAIMAALEARCPGVAFELFTRVPLTFFRQVVRAPITYHELETDIGVVQDGPLHTDEAGTVARLNRFFPLSARLLDSLAADLAEAGVTLVLCDIAPMGLLAAGRAGIPCVLVENFTWDWIYAGFQDQTADLRRHRAYLADCFAQADFRIRTEPVCGRVPADMTTSLVCRPLKRSRSNTRAALGLPAEAPLVLVTMGGIPGATPFLRRLAAFTPVEFIVTGSVHGTDAPDNVHVNVLTLDTYHPDLVAACDAVVGKPGYGTLSEVAQSGTPFGCVRRDGFREGPVLQAYVERRLAHVMLTEPEFSSGTWLDDLPALLAMPRGGPRPGEGADEAAQFLAGLL